MGYAGGMLDTNVPPEQIGQVYGFLRLRYAKSNRNDRIEVRDLA